VPRYLSKRPPDRPPFGGQEGVELSPEDTGRVLGRVATGQWLLNQVLLEAGILAQAPEGSAHYLLLILTLE
jgi:hypothetical protein